jgi:hypothetical protein
VQEQHLALEAFESLLTAFQQQFLMAKVKAQQ